MSLRQHASFRDVVNTIDECDGMSCIQQLQQHDNADISLLAFEITESLFYHENYVRSNGKIHGIIKTVKCSRSIRLIE